MIEFYAAVARKDQKGFVGEGWHPEEAVSRAQALKMFTIWPAYAAFEERLRGSIEVGKAGRSIIQLIRLSGLLLPTLSEQHRTIVRHLLNLIKHTL